MEAISILIVDDHKLVRETWSFVLQTDKQFTVLAEAGSAAEAIAMAKALKPHIVILDINLPDMSGIDTVPLIKKYSPATKVLAVSMHTQPVYVKQMIQKGAMGYVTKNSTRDEMFLALTEIANGRKYICQHMKEIMWELALDAKEGKRNINSLTARELEIIELVKLGNSSKEIAGILKLTVKTVQVHRYNILQKLNLPNASSLVNYINKNQLR